MATAGCMYRILAGGASAVAVALEVEELNACVLHLS
jgi:hypothetical protein